jgi:hypothetical protein
LFLLPQKKKDKLGGEADIGSQNFYEEFFDNLFNNSKKTQKPSWIPTVLLSIKLLF